METQYWIIGQITLDLLMIGLLLWFIRKQSKLRQPGMDPGTALQTSEEIVNQMRTISQELEKNLEQKRALSRYILSQLDESLNKAEERYMQVSKIARGKENGSAREPVSDRKKARTKTSIKALLEKGLSKEEVARHLDMSVGEIDLMLKLRHHDR